LRRDQPTAAASTLPSPGRQEFEAQMRADIEAAVSDGRITEDSVETWLELYEQNAPRVRRVLAALPVPIAATAPAAGQPPTLAAGVASAPAAARLPRPPTTTTGGTMTRTLAQMSGREIEDMARRQLTARGGEDAALASSGTRDQVIQRLVERFREGIGLQASASAEETRRAWHSFQRDQRVDAAVASGRISASAASEWRRRYDLHPAAAARDLEALPVPAGSAAATEASGDAAVASRRRAQAGLGVSSQAPASIPDGVTAGADGRMTFLDHRVRTNSAGEACVQTPNGWMTVEAFQRAGLTRDALDQADAIRSMGTGRLADEWQEGPR
jgi:hypothetical protein